MSDDENIQRVLQCKLTIDERDAKGRELSQAWDDYETIEDEKKDATSELTKRLKKKRAEIGRLAGMLKVGTEPRPILCRWVFDYGHGFKRLIRQDTGDLVEEKTIPIDELQLGMDLNS